MNGELVAVLVGVGLGVGFVVALLVVIERALSVTGGERPGLAHGEVR
jgi:hypothetical protein